MTVENFVKDIKEEQGYKFGTPWRYSDKSLGVIVPILATRIAENRDYITIEEAKDQGVQFKDSGSIDRVIVESSVGKPIFIRSGTMLKSGGTQPRAVESSIIITPEKMQHEIPVKCIYASKGISRGTGFSHGGYVPHTVGTVLLRRGGQSSVWGAVSSTTKNLFATRTRHVGQNTGSFAFASSMDNLVGTMEEMDKFTTDVNNILKNVPLFEDQVGAVFLDMADVNGIELFDHPKSWTAIHKEVEKRMGESGAKEQKLLFKPDYEKIKPLTLVFLDKLINSKKTEVSKHNNVSTVSLDGDGVIGEATLIDDKVIHLLGMKK